MSDADSPDSGATRLLNTLCPVLAVASLILSLILAESYISIERERRDSAHESVYRQATEAVEKIEAALAPLRNIAHDLAAWAEKQARSEQEIYSYMEKQFEGREGIFGVGMAYDRYKWKKDVKLFAPYLVRGEQGLERSPVHKLYDYTQPDSTDGGPRTAWFHVPMSEGPGWTPPFYGTASQTMLAEYAAPFYHPDDIKREGAMAGITTVNYSLNTIDALVASLELGDVGFGFLLDSEGKIIAYPMAKYLGAFLENVEEGNKFLDSITFDAVDGDERVVVDPQSGRRYFVHYKTLPATGWTLGLAYYEEALLNRRTAEYRLLISIVLACSAFLFFAAIMVFRVRWDEHMHLWYTAAGFTGLCMAAIVAVWYLATSTALNREGITLVNNEGVAVAVRRFDIETGNQWYDTGSRRHWKIPTGVFVKSLKFSGPYEVKVTGYIWQRRPDDLPKDIELGYMLPEAEEVNTQLVYDKDGVKGWDFEAELRQPFDYARYPFDREDVWLRLWPKQLWKDVVLVPDLDSYSTTDPSHKPGLEEGVVVEGWHVLESFFSYRKHTYSVDFGFDSSARPGTRMELYYNVGIKREFYSAFVSQMIALIVIAFLLFAVVVTSTKRSSQIELFGFNASSTLQYTSALFFVLIVSHIYLRDVTGAVGILYLEYFYFMMYISILAASVNAILFSLGREIPIIDYDDNFWVKLIYWPALLFPLLLATLYAFF